MRTEFSYSDKMTRVFELLINHTSDNVFYHLNLMILHLYLLYALLYALFIPFNLSVVYVVFLNILSIYIIEKNSETY